jgi:hypothetical protein
VVCVPLDGASLGGRQTRKRFALASELRAGEIRVGERAIGESGVTEVCAAQGCAAKVDTLEDGSAKIDPGKIGETEIHVDKVVPVGGGLGKIGVSKRHVTNLGATEERARQCQSLELGVGKLCAKKADSEYLVVVARRTLLRRWRLATGEQLLINQ